MSSRAGQTMKAAKPGAAKKSDKREVACVAAQPSQPSIRGIAKKVAKMSLQARLQLLVKARVISEMREPNLFPCRRTSP
jgi:hypothetical protein